MSNKNKVENEEIEEQDPEDVYEIPADDENLNKKKIVKLDDVEAALLEQISTTQAKIMKLDDRLQKKLVKLGRVQARLAAEQKKDTQAKRESIGGGA